VDPYTVRIVLKQRNATFLSFLAMGFAGMQSAEYANQLLQQHRAADINRFRLAPGPISSRVMPRIRQCGCQPFILGRPQQTGNLIFAIVTDPQVRIQKLKNNECQMAAAVRETIWMVCSLIRPSSWSARVR
jgi:peptide/nickel transport system substrate-binding protein/dipeptide transport system substrate-binding protein